MQTGLFASISEQDYQEIFSDFLDEFPLYYPISLNLAFIGAVTALFAESFLPFFVYIPSLVWMLVWTRWRHKAPFKCAPLRCFQVPFLIHQKILLGLFLLPWWFTLFTLSWPQMHKSHGLFMSGQHIFDPRIMLVVCTFLIPTFVTAHRAKILFIQALAYLIVFIIGSELIHQGSCLQQPISIAIGFISGLAVAALFHVTAILVFRNRQQQQEIEENTRKIRKILAYTSQGMALIDSGLRVEIHHSPQFREFVRDEAPEGKLLPELLLAFAELQADEREMFLQALDLATRDQISFELNSAHLPKKLRFLYPDGKERLMDATWDPIPADQDKIQHLLLSLNDITEAEANKRRELDLQAKVEDLAALIDQNPDHIKLFAHRAQEMLAQLEFPMSSADVQAQQLESKSLILLHTLKGNARSLGFKRMASMLHHIESDLIAEPSLSADYRRDHWQNLKAELDRLSLLIEKYYGIAIRNGYYQIPKHLVTALLAKPLSQEAAAICHSCFPPLFEFVLPFFKQLDSLSLKLGKTPPHIKLEGDNPFVLESGAHILQGIFPHLIANALDHGIEPSSHREAQGKPPTGVIAIRVQWQAEELTVSFGDDGGGLNLTHLAEKAKTIYGEEQACRMNAVELASLIFLPGFSTLTQVHEVSGRGIGMAAVKAILLEVGGGIEIQFNDTKRSDGQQNFRFLLRLPRSYFHPVQSSDIRSLG